MKRYGRNQKRAHLAKMKEMERKLTISEQNLDCEKERVIIARKIVEMARNINPNSVVFEPRSYSGYRLMVDSFDFMAHCYDANSPMEIDIRTIDLYDLEIALDNNEFRDAVHFECSLGGQYGGRERSGYRISKMGLQYARIDDIVKELVRHLRGGGALDGLGLGLNK